MSKPKIKQDVTLSKTGKSTIGYVTVGVRSNLTEPYVLLGEHNITLTRASAGLLIRQLEIALALEGQDFLIHFDGTISVTVDYETYNYDTLEDYKNGIVSSKF